MIVVTNDFDSWLFYCKEIPKNTHTITYTVL